MGVNIINILVMCTFHLSSFAAFITVFTGGVIIKDIRYLNIPNTFVIQKIEPLKIDLLSWAPVEFSTYHPSSSCFVHIFIPIVNPRMIKSL